MRYKVIVAACLLISCNNDDMDKYLGKEPDYVQTTETCIEGHYQEYLTSGLAVAKSTASAQHVDSVWVCTETRIDTIPQLNK